MVLKKVKNDKPTLGSKYAFIDSDDYDFKKVKSYPDKDKVVDMLPVIYKDENGNEFWLKRAKNKLSTFYLFDTRTMPHTIYLMTRKGNKEQNEI